MPTDRSDTPNTSAACRYVRTDPDSSAAATRSRTTSCAAGAGPCQDRRATAARAAEAIRTAPASLAVPA
ncbi:hypothetical protein [Streptomyces sp. NPDC002265]|uniref:hypothetical protein n=1 Tax=Streptomyces sp. NPDC002265 TaxID=3154415 RepID=UPI00332A7CFF